MYLENARRDKTSYFPIMLIYDIPPHILSFLYFLNQVNPIPDAIFL